jgi:S-methyl-5-thioribulose 1-phosphate isomerase
MVPGGQELKLSGDRYTVDYLLTVGKDKARTLAEHICYEQTVEFPADLIPDGEIKSFIVGKIESLERIDPDRSVARISFAVEITGFEFTQFLNNLFGNISILPGIRIINIQLPESLLKIAKGPRFGKKGVQEIFGVQRPLICTALKPLGLSAEELADQAYQFAAGGIDLIKDDHGICNQTFSPFNERVEKCSEAVKKANQKFGTKTLYLPNISGSSENINKWAVMAKNSGAGGLLIAPGLVGMDTMKSIAENNSIGLPIMAHPAFGGTYVISDSNGISHGVLYGLLMRLAGADITVFPNFGGRFSFSKKECMDIALNCSTVMKGIKSILPAPGGGMTTDRLPEMIDAYGNDLVLLIGGGLHRHSEDIKKNTEHFREMVEK